MNMSKVATPELAEKIVANIKQACPASADNMSGTLAAPDGYEPPVVRLVIVDPDQLTLNGEVTDRPTLFFVGKMFVLRGLPEALKDFFSVLYGDIECSVAGPTRPGTSTSPTALRRPPLPGSGAWAGASRSTTCAMSPTTTSEPSFHPNGVF